MTRAFLCALLVSACSIRLPSPEQVTAPRNNTPGPSLPAPSAPTGLTAPTGAGEPEPADPCGNGVLESGESCDDGSNNGTYDHCLADCSGAGPSCGDGVTNGPEVCDDPAHAGEPSACSLSCDGLSPAATAYPEFAYVTVAPDAGEQPYRNAHRYCVPTATEPCDCAFCYPLSATATVDDPFVNARVRYVGHDEWQLDLQAKPTLDPNRRITLLRFPLMQFHPHEWPSPSGALRYMTPYIAGEELLAEAHPSSYSMAGLPYPGGFFSPWTIMTDDQKAIVIWASNWPPKTTMVMHGGRALENWYQSDVDPLNSETPAPGEARAFRYTMRTVTKLAGSEPWHLAVDAYTEWFNKHPVPAFEYPDWIRTAPGLFAMGLQNIQDETVARPYNINDGLTNLIDAWKDYFPWVSFWGQMSGEHGECCTPDYSIHPRYRTMASASGPVDLLERVETWKAEGMHVGFYSAPKWDAAPPFYLTSSASADYLYGWMNAHQTTHGANAFYIDTLARTVWGPALYVANMFALAGHGGLISANTMIEGAVDLMPSVYLLAGGISGCCVELSTTGTLVRKNPALAAYALADRISVHGDLNGDHTLAGPANNYVLERQTFLLGAKFASTYPVASYTILRAMMDARAAASWYDKHTRYRDRRDLGAAPSGIDVRKFATNTSESLLVFDNPNEVSGATILHQGHSVAIPATKFGIISD